MTGDLHRKIKKMRSQGFSWRFIGQTLGISSALAWKIAEQNYEPKNATLRMQLGYPVLALAPVCPRCQIVHVARRCPRRSKRYRSLFDIPTHILRRMLENREDL
jgi:hypothetical protein